MWKNPAHWEQRPSLDGDQRGNKKVGRASNREQGTKQRSSMVSASIFVSVFLSWVPPSVITWLHCKWLLESCFLLTGCPQGPRETVYRSSVPFLWLQWNMLYLHPNSVSSDLWLNRDPFSVFHILIITSWALPVLERTCHLRFLPSFYSGQETKDYGVSTESLLVCPPMPCWMYAWLCNNNLCIRLILRYKKGSQTITQCPRGAIIYHMGYCLRIKARGRECGRRAPGVLGIIKVFSIFAFLNPWTHKLGSNRPKVTICRRKIGMDDKRKPFITVGMWKGRRSSICDMQIKSRSKETAL